MALLRGCLPLVPFLVIVISHTASAYGERCHRVFPLHLTATAMPCRYLCAYSDGHITGYRIQGENDGTPCRVHGSEGVCWYGLCLTRYGEQNEQFQHIEDGSKGLHHLRKRDVAAVKGVSTTKTTVSDGDSSFSTKSVRTVKTVKTTNDNVAPPSVGSKGFGGSYMTSFTSNDGTKGGTTEPSMESSQFSLKTSQSGTPAAGSFFSLGGVSGHASKGGRVKITVHRGPNGEKVTRRTVTRLVIKQGPTHTVRRVIITRKSRGGSTNFMGSGIKGARMPTIAFTRPSTGQRNVLLIGGNTGVNRKSTQVTTVRTVTAARNPLTSIVRTVSQQRISGGHNFGGPAAATKTVSTVSVTKKVTPVVSVVQGSNHGISPLTSASVETEKTAALKGLEVEVPGYTAGLRQNWKWVLARRVGMYPPYVQVLDPDVLYYKLGLQKPQIPGLPVPVQDVLNRVPVHPVGSDLYGFLLSSRILERIRGFTDRFKNGLSRLNSMLSTTNGSQLQNSNFLTNLFTGTQSAPLGSTILQKILLESLSGSGNSPLSSPYGGFSTNSYGGLFGVGYSGPYDSPWGRLPRGPFPTGSLPLYAGGPTRYDSFPRSSSDYRFDSYDSLGGSRNPTHAGYSMSEDERILPVAETPSSKSAEHLFRDSSYLNTLLYPRHPDSDTTEGRLGFSHGESPDAISENIAKLLAQEKLRHLLRNPSKRDSLTRRIIQAMNTRHSELYPEVLNRPRYIRKKQLYKRIIRELLRRKNHGRMVGQSEFRESYGTESDTTDDLLSTLRLFNARGRDNTISTPRTQPRVLELLNELGSKHGPNRHSAVNTILRALKHRRQHENSRGTSDASDVTELIEDILTSSGRQPSSDTTSEISKEITKALLTSRRGPVPTERRRDAHVSKLVSVHGASHVEANPQRVTQGRVFSATYQANKLPGTTSIPYYTVTTPSLEATRSVTQQSQTPYLQGINSYSASMTGPSPLQPYTPLAQQPVYAIDGTGVSSQSALLNHQYVSSTGTLYGSTVPQPAASMVTGAGYTGYSTLPTNAAYLSQYTSQPYYLGTSVYGSHPHYVVEGHEAPGTRWQLRVWRHYPGVSAGAPGFGSSHLGSVVTKARETVTRGLQLGTQPGHFGFAAFGPGVTQTQGGVSGWDGSMSQYSLRAPDGSLLLTRQPLSYAPSTGAVVSQITKTTTKTTSASPFTTGTAGLESNLYSAGLGGEASKSSTTETKIEAVKQQISTAGNGKSDLLSQLSQNKVTPFSDLSSDSGTEGTASSSSSTGSSSSSVQTTEDLSQSKVRR